VSAFHGVHGSFPRLSELGFTVGAEVVERFMSFVIKVMCFPSFEEQVFTGLTLEIVAQRAVVVLLECP
jgi:hypothetical protein